MLQVPTPELVASFAARFDADRRYGPADRALERLFRQWPLNAELEAVLTKVTVLNSLYSTNVFATVDMAEHIRGLSIDDELRKGSYSVVDKVARLTAGGKARRHYSFAAKYCGWHSPEQFPLYDNLVERLIWQYQKEFTFAAFKRDDLQDYERFAEVIPAFRRFFKVEQASLRSVDKFLWLSAKDAKDAAAGRDN